MKDPNCGRLKAFEKALASLSNDEISKVVWDEIEYQRFMWRQLPAQTRVLIKMGLVEDPRPFKVGGHGSDKTSD